MIAKGDAKAGSAKQNEKQDYLEPIDAEIPEVDGDSGDGEDESSDKERTRQPINAMEWNAGKHDTLFTTCSQRAKTTSFFVQL